MRSTSYNFLPLPLHLLSITFLLVLQLQLAVVDGAEKEVIELTDHDFRMKTDNGNWVVEFYAPWCGHCKQIEPEFERAAKAVKKVKKNSFFGKIDCTVNKDTCQTFGIKGYPTIKGHLHQSERFIDYYGAREEYDLTKFALNLDTPAIKSLDATGNSSSMTNQFLTDINNAKVAFLYVGAKEDLAPTHLRKKFVESAQVLKMQAKFFDVIDGHKRSLPHNPLNKIIQECRIKDTSVEWSDQLLVIKSTSYLDNKVWDCDLFDWDVDKSVLDYVNKNNNPTVFELKDGGSYQAMRSNPMKPVLLMVLKLKEHPENSRESIRGFTSKAIEYSQAYKPLQYAYMDMGKFETFLGNTFYLYKHNVPTLVLWDFHNDAYYIDDEMATFTVSDGTILPTMIDTFVSLYETDGLQPRGNSYFEQQYRMVKAYLVQIYQLSQDNPKILTIVMSFPLLMIIIFYFYGFSKHEEKKPASIDGRDDDTAEDEDSENGDGGMVNRRNPSRKVKQK